jgi:pimeloyl-ACP methyl ester carboxylesterase
MTHIIYISGFGEHFDFLRRLALRRWGSADTKVTFVPMRWNNRQETYEQRYERVAEAIEQAKGDEMVLVGESAGSAMAMLAFSRQLGQVSRVVTICGYNHGASDVHQIHKKTHPAFYDMMPVVDEVVEHFNADARSRITTLYSTRDRVVTPKHSRIDGANEVVLHTRGHSLNIARILLGPAVY